MVGSLTLRSEGNKTLVSHQPPTKDHGTQEAPRTAPFVPDIWLVHLKRNISPQLGTLRARVATLTKHRRPGDPELIRAAQELKTVRLEEFIIRTLDRAPALTTAQYERIIAAVGRGAR